MSTPRLITPEGKTIELSQETYQQIKKLLQEGDVSVPKQRRVAEIRETYGKYAGQPSLIETLMKERREERAREEAKFKRRNG
jgi:S-adenosylmethionine:tRNA-ribosyltransferase-isomerase (queuine synthetase)